MNRGVRIHANLRTHEGVPVVAYGNLSREPARIKHFLLNTRVHRDETHVWVGRCGFLSIHNVKEEAPYA